MAFFDYMKARFETLVGGLFKPVSGVGTGGNYPAPDCKAQGGNYMENAPLQTDKSGNLLTRGPVLTDEESFLDDFIGSALVSSITGTLTFTAGSNAVSGSGTAFLTDLVSRQGGYYIKLTSAAETYWARVLIVNSDDSLVLKDNWGGTTGTGASHKSLWRTSTGTGGAIAVANSNCNVAAGTTHAAKTFVYREADYSPIMTQIMCSVSQRIAGQETWVGFFDDPVTPTQYAVAVLDGTDPTVIKFRTASNNDASDIEETTHFYPNGTSSGTNGKFEISVVEGRAILSLDGLKISEHVLHVPGIYNSLCYGFGIVNTGTPATATTLVVNSGFLKNANRLEIANNYRGDALPVKIYEDAYTVYGVLTTSSTAADQIICQYTVPAGKYLYVLGYRVSSGNNAVYGNPVKLGKNSLTEVQNAVNGQVLMGQVLSNREFDSQTFATPLYLGAGISDVVKMSVTPSASASCTWRCAIDFVLR